MPLNKYRINGPQQVAVKPARASAGIRVALGSAYAIAYTIQYYSVKWRWGETWQAKGSLHHQHKPLEARAQLASSRTTG